MSERNSASPFELNPVLRRSDWIEHEHLNLTNVLNSISQVISWCLFAIVKSCDFAIVKKKSKQKTNNRPMRGGGVNVPSDIIIRMNESCMRLSSSAIWTYKMWFTIARKQYFHMESDCNIQLTAAAARQVKNKNKIAIRRSIRNSARRLLNELTNAWQCTNDVETYWKCREMRPNCAKQSRKLICRQPLISFKFSSGRPLLKETSHANSRRIFVSVRWMHVQYEICA